MIAEEINSNFTTPKLDELRCSNCKGYLSCSPIRVLPNGSCICGRCSPSNCDTPVYRVLQFEAILSDVLFPCQFMKNGCTRRSLFGTTAEHEATCSYRMFTCPSLKSCSWEGFSSQLHYHFDYKHPDLAKGETEFSFKVGQDDKGFFTFTKDDLFFVFKYLYNQTDKALRYDMRSSVQTEHDVFYKLQLISDSDSDCNLNLKLSKCLPFDNSFYEMQNAAKQNLNTVLKVLGEPSSVTVVINLKVIKATCDTTQRELVETKAVVDYNLLESVRCIKCQYYLIAPLFSVSAGGTVCYACSRSYSNLLPVNDTKLTHLVATLNYPCQWRGCDFVGKSNDIKIHRLSCRFRSYRCVVPKCKDSFSLSSVENHLKCNHKDVEYSVQCAYKISFSNASQAEYYSVTIKDNRLLRFRHFMNYYFAEHVVVFYSDITGTTISIQFQHEHCTLKSKIFTLNSNAPNSLMLSHLPSCFTKDETLTVVICDSQRESM